MKQAIRKNTKTTTGSFLHGYLMLAIFLFATGWQTAALAASEKQLSAIAEMGRLNGIALQCRYLEQIQRIKRQLVLNLPKQRALGDWFEQKTNASFMAFMKNNDSCPGVANFDKALQQAEADLQAVFKQ